MNLSARYLRHACAALLVLFAGLAWAAPAQATTTFSGRAFAAFVNTGLTGPLFISDTGELPPSGGFRSDSLLDTRDLNLATLDGVLRAEVLVASTSGASGKASSSASLANVVVLPGHPAQLTASFVRAEAEATCEGVRGETEVAEVTFGGQTIEVPPGGFPANYAVTIPGVATLIINEQTTTVNGTYREIRVNAIHLIVPGVAEVILSSAKSDINCVPPVTSGPCHDFVTGGGWVTVASSRANFGFNAGFKDGATVPEVHLTYIDHNTGMKLKATSITAYSATGATSRQFTGKAEVNGVAGYIYTVDVADNREPGRDSDTFVISLSNGYGAGGTLAGGNIQLHKPCN
ncbi:MAG TPA: choice-of-anchor P family protein [Methylomirabilota bacterium]|nr:choice-of-anchor P family protein [Methylomirabilota bacterium]